MAKIKSVIDTNVFARALIGSASCEKTFNAFIDGFFELAISRDMLLELAEVLSRPKLKIPQKVVKEFFHLIRHKITVVKPKIKINACRDPSDNIILETAIAAEVDIIVTNDNDLLILNPFRNIPIVTPYEFLKRLKIN